jgi:hypothetical protein
MNAAEPKKPMSACLRLFIQSLLDPGFQVQHAFISDFETELSRTVVQITTAPIQNFAGLLEERGISDHFHS